MLNFQTVEESDGPRLTIVRQLFTDYQKELGVDLCFQGFDEELATLPGKYGPPEGRLLILYEADAPVACGALRKIGDGICELKRIYVVPDARGRSYGRLMSEKLIEVAQEMRYRTVRLDTLTRLERATDLYEKLGFVRIPAYNPNPEPDVAYFERTLS